MRNVKWVFVPLFLALGLPALTGCPSNNNNTTAPAPVTLVELVTATWTPTLTPGGYPGATWTPTVTRSATPTFTVSPTSTPVTILEFITATLTATSTPGGYPGATWTPTATPNTSHCSTPIELGNNSLTCSQGGYAQGILLYSSFNLSGPSSRTLWDVQANLSTSAAVSLQAAVYNQDTGNLVETSYTQPVSNSSPQWTIFYMPTPQTMIPGNYIMGIYTVNGSGRIYVSCDGAGTNINLLFPYSGFTSTFNNTPNYTNPGTLAIFADICP